jgi:hypothetical protein
VKKLTTLERSFGTESIQDYILRKSGWEKTLDFESGNSGRQKKTVTTVTHLKW